MRERFARRLAFLTGALVLVLALSFAALRNLPGGTAGAQVASESALLAQGRAVYEEQNCARCHAIAGVGNARNPLDGVGARLPADHIRARTIGEESEKDDLPAGPFAAKQVYRKLPAGEIDALVAYLQSLH